MKSGTGKASTCVSLLGWFVLAAAPALADLADAPRKLSWAPPALVDPVVKSIGPQRSNLKLDKAKDYILKLPENEPYVGELNIYGGHNVVVIGGTVRIPTDEQGYTGSKRAVYLKEQTGTIHIEGLHITGDGLHEGFNLDEREPGCVVQLQNIRVEYLRGSYSDNHADVIQTWAGPDVLRIDGLTGFTQYQGFFLLPNQHFTLEDGGFVPSEWDFRNINLVGDETASAYLLWTQSGDTQPPIALTNVWARPRTQNLGNRPQYLWPKNDPVWNPVLEGLPPDGDFVPAESCGIGYVSPGYLTDPPAEPDPSVEPEEPEDIAASAPDGAYLWTGRTDRDFENPGNWAVKTGGAWTAAASAPANAYGEADIYFAGDASQCPNMPLLTVNHIVHQIHFLSSGWTIDAARSDPLDDTSAFCTLQVAKGYGGWGGSGVYGGHGDEIGILDEASAADGGTNTIAAPLYQPGGLKVDVAAGAVLRLDGKLDLNSTGTGLGSQSVRMGFFGEGTLVLSGTDGNTAVSRSFEMTAGRLVLAKDPNVAAVCVNNGGFDVRGGRVEMLADGQFRNSKSPATLYLSGDSVVDFGGHACGSYAGDLVFGAKYSDSGVGAVWTGSITNTANVQLPRDRSLVVNPTSARVVFDGGLKGPHNWHGANEYFKVADIPGLDEELVFDGPLFDNDTGNYGSTANFQGRTCDGVFSVGAVSLNAPTSLAGTYAKVYINATVYANASDGNGALGKPAVFEVQAPFGVLGGHGKARTNAADVPVTVYGTVAPGSPARRSGTLTVGEEGATASVAFMTNSVLSVGADADGTLPRLMVHGGVSLQTVPDGAADAAAPRVRITGPVVPKFGRQEILRATGAFSGAFDENVERQVAESERTGVYSLLTVTEGTDTVVYLRHSPVGLFMRLR